LDISVIKPVSEGLPVEIVHPATGEPLGITVRVRSSEEKVVKDVARQFLDKQTKLKARGKDLTTDDYELWRIKTLQTSIISWTWGKDVSWNGKKPDPDIEFLTELVQTATWFAEQIEDVARDTSAFFLNSKATSSAQ
jgi:hypothetical protein